MKQTDVLVKQLYPKISNIMSKNENKFKQMVGRFMEKRSKELHDIAPCDRIYFGSEDVEDFYKTIPIPEKEVIDILSQTYYYPMANFNPRAAKDPLTVIMIMIIRYFYLHNKPKELEMASVYLSFSGKFYPSIHSGSFPTVQPSEYRHIMEYVVNNRLNQQFDLKSEGSVFGAIRSRAKTWLDTYTDRIRSCDDEDVVYLIQQLHNRIKSFMKNIAEVYYEVYDDKDSYLTYDSDNLDDTNYHIADNDSLKIERAVENAMNYLNSNSVDYKVCIMSSDSNVKTDEIKSIIETILADNNNIPLVKELLRLTISDYFSNSEKKDIRDVEFIKYSITPKPNSKNKDIIRQKEIIEEFLSENSPAYRKRRSRLATKNSYYRSLLTYFVIVTHNSNK